MAAAGISLPLATAALSVRRISPIALLKASLLARLEHAGSDGRDQGGAALSTVKPSASTIATHGLRSAECSQPQPRSTGKPDGSSQVQARPPSRDRASTIRPSMPASRSLRPGGDAGGAAADNNNFGIIHSINCSLEP